MLDKARERNLYARLEHLDLLSMMRSEPAAGYDVLFAADVLVYIGKLDDLAKQARRLLRPMGFFTFSVESLEALNEGASATDQLDYSFNVTGRYAHSIAYLHRMATCNGFEVLSTTTTKAASTRANPFRLPGALALPRRRA
jgi:predicted TPR repeat methyltransferase